MKNIRSYKIFQKFKSIKDLMSNDDGFAISISICGISGILCYLICWSTTFPFIGMIWETLFAPLQLLLCGIAFAIASPFIVCGGLVLSVPVIILFLLAGIPVLYCLPLSIFVPVMRKLLFRLVEDI